MTIRIRKLVGTVVLLALVTAWALLAMALAQFMLVSGWMAGLYYVVAGLGWVLPAMPLIRWMQRPDPEPR